MSAPLPIRPTMPRLGPYRLADYDRLPDYPRHELVFGKLRVTPSPFSRHQVAVQVLFRHLERIAKRSGGIVFVAPLDVVLADHSVVQPDLLYVSASRLAVAGDRIEGAPDLVVEVLSRGSARFDHGRKLQLYALFGIREYWLVDHERRRIELLVNESGRFAPVLPAGHTYQSPALPEVRLDPAKLWRQMDAWLVRLPQGR